MKPSPVQLLQLTFRKVCVELDEKHCPSEPPNPLTSPFSFEGVTLKTNVGIGEREEAPAEEGNVYQLDFELIVDNEVRHGEKGQRFSPYLIDVRVAAIVRVPPGAQRLGPPRDLGIVNGAALLWSALREQIANVTSRMPMGQVMLPTVHFHDLKSDAQQPAVAANAALKRPRLPERKKATE